MPIKTAMYYIPRTSIDSATFNASYQAINATGTTEPCWSYDIINNSTIDVDISLDGVTAHDFVASKSAKVIDVQTNSRPNSQENLFPKGTIVYVNGATSGTGLVYLVGRMNPIINGGVTV